MVSTPSGPSPTFIHPPSAPISPSQIEQQISPILPNPPLSPAFPQYSSLLAKGTSSPAPISPTAVPPPIISGIQVDPAQFQRSPQAKTTIRMVHDRLRRQSYDVRVLNPNGTVASHSQLRPQRTASARLNPSFTSPSLASTLSIGSLQAKRRHSRVISFGYASAGFYVRRGPDDEEWLEEFEFECERPSTSQSVNDDEECCCDLPMPGAISGGAGGLEEDAVNGIIAQQNAAVSGDSSSANAAISPSPQYRSRPLQGAHSFQNGHYQKNGNAAGGGLSSSQQHQPMALFLLRHADHRILPVYCYRPQGIQADQFIQSLTEKNREAIKKFMEKEGPEEGECYLWVRDDVTMKTTVLSLTLLQNHFKSEHIRRVKWRHLSVDKVSVYRYSLPVITTKFRLRVAHFLARHYRCCILGVWCLVILCISIGIVLSVVFGSAPGTQKGNNGTVVPIQAAVQRSGGFMEDAIEMEQAAAQTERPPGLNKQLVMVSGGRIAPPGSLQGIIGNMPRLKRRRRRK